MLRLVVFVTLLAIGSGAVYLSYTGVLGASSDVERSIRLGSPGGGYGIGGRVK